MSEVKDPAIKLFGRTISLPLIPNHSSPLTRPPSSSSPCQVSSETEEPSRKELTSVVQDDGASQQTTEDVKSPTTSSGISENAKTPSAETETSLLKSSTNGEQSETTSVSEEKTPKKPDKILPCPRCHSMDTKFCYYNNYNVNQPRHFCKNCQRYWTAGGTMRNVPIGAGRRKNKNSSSSHYRHMMVPEALQGAKLNAPNAVMGNGAAVLTFGSEPPLCDSMASVLNIAERTQNCVPNGFNATEPNNFVSYGKEDDHSSGVSVTTSTSSERQGPTGSHDKRIEGFPPQLQYFPSSSWPYAWNSAQWNSSMPPPAPAFCPPGYPLSFYTTPAYWGCVPGPPPSWNMSCISPQSSAHGSVPNAPTLGKHSRDGNIITPTNSQKEKAETEHNSAENNILIPKTLRIDDDSSEAAKSSMWSKVGMKNDKGNSVNGGGLFQAFPSKGNDKNHMVEASPMLHANPAALSRSLTFHEQT